MITGGPITVDVCPLGGVAHSMLADISAAMTAIKTRFIFVPFAPNDRLPRTLRQAVTRCEHS